MNILMNKLRKEMLVIECSQGSNLITEFTPIYDNWHKKKSLSKLLYNLSWFHLYERMLQRPQFVM